MASKGVDFDTVWEMGLALPGAKKFRYYGLPALKVRRQMFACKAGHTSAEPNTLIVSVGFAKRDRLIKADSKIFYVRPHYEPYPSVLVRLHRIDRDTLRRLLRSAYRAVSTGRVKPMQRKASAPRTRAAATRSTARTTKRSAKRSLKKSAKSSRKK